MGALGGTLLQRKIFALSLSIPPVVRILSKAIELQALRSPTSVRKGSLGYIVSMPWFVLFVRQCSSNFYYKSRCKQFIFWNMIQFGGII
jgi:hypothetical protein